MKNKTDYFTKFITFCVLSLFLITNMILFTSCDNGNSPNDNTNEEQNNNAPTDYCEICDGVQDKNHQHDYCDDCEGIDGKDHTCPVEEPTLSAEVEHIGNGTYTIANFMVNDNADDSIDKKVSDGLECAEKYIKGITEEFSNDFKTKYASLITNLQNDETYNQDTTSGFDPLINTLKNNCKPIFENMITKVNDSTGLDQCNIIGYYKAFENETYIKALGDYATNDNKIEYKEKATDAKNWADDTYNIAGDEVVFNPEITNKMDTLLSKYSSNIGISTSDLQKLINLSLSISSLDAMHDYSVSKKLSTHTWTCDGGNNTLDDDMINTF